MKHVFIFVKFTSCAKLARIRCVKPIQITQRPHTTDFSHILVSECSDNNCVLPYPRFVPGSPEACPEGVRRGHWRLAPPRLQRSSTPAIYRRFVQRGHAVEYGDACWFVVLFLLVVAGSQDMFLQAFLMQQLRMTFTRA